MKEKNIDDYRREFYQIYHKEIRPKLEVFENTRKTKLGQCIFYESLAISALIALLCSANFIRGLYYEIACVLLVLALILIPYFMNKNFIKMLKNECKTSFMKVFGDVIWEQNTDFINSEDLNKSELFAYFNRRSSDDSFEGKYNEVDYAISETKLIYERGSGKRRKRNTIFKGIIIRFASNKTIRNKTIITTKGDTNTAIQNKWSIIIAALLSLSYFVYCKNKMMVIVGLIFTMLVLWPILFPQKNKEILEEINLEDPVFEKKFNVYSSDEVESRYLITTAFMERFNNLNTSFGAQKAKCSFYGTSIMFAISTNKNLFEIGNLFRRLDNPKQITEFFNEVVSVLSLVDYFKLDEHIKI